MELCFCIKHYTTKIQVVLNFDLAYSFGNETISITTSQTTKFKHISIATWAEISYSYYENTVYFD